MELEIVVLHVTYMIGIRSFNLIIRNQPEFAYKRNTHSYHYFFPFRLCPRSHRVVIKWIAHITMHRAAKMDGIYLEFRMVIDPMRRVSTEQQ